MNHRQAIRAVVCASVVAATAQAGDRPGDFTLLSRIAPVGGCNPDGRGLLHWWEPDCFPRPCGPDDYCRKPFPRFCWRPAALTSTSRSTQATAGFGQRVIAR
jgi:hypothetical protein